MLDQVQRAIQRHTMARPGHCWGVAASGGPDSMALLEALVELADSFDIRLVVVHFNHQLRGAESDEDEAFVKERALALGLPFHRDASTGDAAHGGNLEAAARDARYRFFERLLARGVCDRIATGHTRSDQAETVLFRVLRGASLTALAGVRPVRDPGIVRPLIETSRREVLDWLAEKGVSWRHDSSNLDLSFSRNRLRRQLLPQLAREWNPQVEDALARLGAQAASEEAYWERVVGEAIEGAALRNGDGAEIDCLSARVLDDAVLVRCLARLARDVKAPGRQFGGEALETLQMMVRGAGPREAHLPGLIAQRSCDFLRLIPGDAASVHSAAAPAAPPDELVSPDGRSRVVLRLDDPSVAGDGRALLDWEKLPALELRAWRSGDRLSVSGGGGEKSLREMFRAARIPAWDRALWPVLASDSGVVAWSRGFGFSGDFPVVPSTSTALSVTEVASDGTEIRGLPDWSRCRGRRWTARLPGM